MPALSASPLSTRLVVSNGLLFALGTAGLAFSPATVSEQPVLSEVFVLAVGLAVIVVANSFLVHSAVAPLDRLAGDLDRVRSGETGEGVPVPSGGLARNLAVSVNDLLQRIDAGRRERDVAALAGQESERSRIAQELHDGVGQSLTALMLELGVTADRATPPAPQTLRELQETTRSCLDELRRVSRDLRPHVLEDLGLRSALAALTNDLFGRSGTHVSRGVVPGLPELDDPTELVVFRVAQEALSNVARHARAKTVELTLAPRGGWLRLVVADDGVGIPHDATGTGLRGMAERAELVGGSLSVARREGGGTIVTLEVPQ